MDKAYHQKWFHVKGMIYCKQQIYYLDLLFFYVQYVLTK